MMKIIMGNYSYTEDEQISALIYMYGISRKEVIEGIKSNKYSENDIKKSILYQETEGIKPYNKRKEIYERALKEFGVMK